MTNPKQWKKHVETSKDIFFRGHSDIFRAFEFSMHYSVFYDALIRSLVTEASRKIFGTESPQGVAVYAFGAPSRKEMFGGSDADVAFYRAGKSEKELELRDCVVKALQDYDFTKVDPKNLKKGRVNMIEAGIVDPLKVTRSALENAASMASVFLTTEVAVTDLPEEKKENNQPVGEY